MKVMLSGVLARQRNSYVGCECKAPFLWCVY